MTKQVRDWQKDTELLQKKPRYTIDEVNHIIYNVAPYWLQQYAAEKSRADAAESKEKKLREEMEILSIKVKILFLTNYVYSDSSFEALDELILPLNDAKELVNKGVAVIDYIYS